VGETELEQAADQLAAALAPLLVEEAKAEAVASVRAELHRTLTAALQREVEETLIQTWPDGVGLSAIEPEDGEEEHPASGTTEPVPPTPSSHPLAEAAHDTAKAFYVYGVVEANTTLPDGLTGVDDRRPVRLIEREGLAAIVSTVLLSEFDEEPLRRHLNDVAWLEEKARRHEDVLEAALGQGAVVPLRLCTVFASEHQVGEMLRREREVLLDALVRLDGKAEWGVKVFADPRALEREVLIRSDSGNDAEGVPAGTAYMNRKRREASARAEAEEVADEWSHEIHERLAAQVAEALLNPLQRSEASGHGGEMLLNGVYLVADADADRFRELVSRLAEVFDRRGVDIALTGPWPGYNFVKSSIEAAR
jgi:hypothetical protein